MKFKNPAKGYVEEVSAPGLWVFLSGFIYFAIKGVWKHAIASFFLVGFTLGISWFIYPFLAKGIMRKRYLAEGWTEVLDVDVHAGGTDASQPVHSDAPRIALSVLALWFVLILLFLGLWQILNPDERRPAVSFTEFVSWVHDGQVPEVRVKGGVYTFRRVVDGKAVIMETHGPAADAVMTQDLQNNPLAKEGKFKIYFE